MTPTRVLFLLSALSVLALCGCSLMTGPAKAPLDAKALDACERLQLDPDQIAQLEAKPIYRFSEEELGVYLAYLQEVEPDLPTRVVRIGRKNLGQPYEMFLLGEHPYENYDPQPLYCLGRSDCVVFSEHTYAMALSNDWPTFFRTLQRIRYKDGRIGVTSRNHYTEADWDRNNRWLVRDVTDEVAPGRSKPFTQTVDRTKFFKKRYKLETDIPKEKLESTYVPWEAMEEAVKNLRNGDFVNVMYDEESPYASHTGLIAIAEDGTVDFLHSTPPRVREESILAYVDRLVKGNEKRIANKKAPFVGFKFLRLETDPLANLRALDGPDAPKVSLGSPVKGRPVREE